MAIKFESKEKQVQKKSVKKQNVVAEQVEALVKLKKEADKAKAVIAEYDGARKALMELIPEDASDFEPVIFEGETHNAVFSARAAKRSVADLQKLHSILGNKVFYEIASVPLTEVDKYLSEEEKEQVLMTAHTGPRVIKIEEK